MAPIKPVENRNPDGTFGPGNNANPNGRPKGQTLKEFAREYYLLKSPEEKQAYIDKVEEKRPGFAWEMAEGKAQQDVTSGGQAIAMTIVNYGDSDTPPVSA